MVARRWAEAIVSRGRWSWLAIGALAVALGAESWLTHQWPLLVVGLGLAGLAMSNGYVRATATKVLALPRPSKR